MAEIISPTAAMSRGWQLFSKNWTSALMLIGVVIGAQLLMNMVMGVFSGNDAITLALVFLSPILSGYLTYGYMKGNLAIHDGQPVSAEVFKQPISPVARQILGTMAYALLAGLGFFLFIIPGIYLSLKYIFVPILLTDKDMSIGDAFSQSGKMTNGRKINLFVFSLLSLVVSLVGLLALLVGIIPASAVITLGTMVLYREYSKAVSAA